MKILIFYQYFGTPQGSWSTRVYEFCRRWVAEGHEVTVVTCPYEKSDIQAKGFISHQEVDGIKLIVIDSGDSNRLSVLKRGGRAMLFALLSVWYALRLRYDVIIASSGPITVGFPLIAAHLFRKKPTVFEVRDLWPAGGIEMGLIKSRLFQLLALRFEKMCYHHSSMIIAASPGQQAHILKRYPDLNVKVIPNASDNELFGRKAIGALPDWAQGKMILTHIGSIGYIHNVRYWMQLAKEIAKRPGGKDILWVFIGEGAERQEMENFKEQWGLENVIFMGLMPKSQLPFWVQNSTATLFATLDNPVQDASSPNKIFDSFAAGIPIIQTTNGWIYDLVASEQCGINIRLNDVEESANLVWDYVHNRQALKEHSLQAKNLAKTTFNRDHLAKQYLNSLQEIAEKA